MAETFSEAAVTESGAADGMSYQKVMIASALAFLSTTIDDFVVIIYFMCRAETRLAKAQLLNIEPELSHTESYFVIFLGVVLGFTVIVALSLCGRVFAIAGDVGYICLLGFIPICIGGAQVAALLRAYLAQRGHEEAYDACLYKVCEVPGWGTCVCVFRVSRVGCGRCWN